MTATTVAIKRERYDCNNPVATLRPLFLAASTILLAGVLVAVNSSGYLTTVSGSDPTVRVIGVAPETVDNSSGSAGDVSMAVEKGTFPFSNSSDDEEITNAHVGMLCYAVDNQTVSLQSNLGTRPIAGVIHHVDDDGVWVEVGVQFPRNGIDYVLEANADLRTLQYTWVVVTTNSKVAANSTAGGKTFGILQNAPNTGQPAIVRTLGPSLLVSDSTGWSVGDAISSTSGGLGRASTNQATGLAHTNTNDAGSTTDPLIAAYCGAMAVQAATSGQTKLVDVRPQGALATTAI